MSQDIIFSRMADDFAASVAGFRNGQESAYFRNIGTRLYDARRHLHRSVSKMGVSPSKLDVSNFVRINVKTIGVETELCSKLSMRVGTHVQELPVATKLGKVLPDDFFRHICVESYRIAKGDEEKYFTGEELQERFTEQLNLHLPKDCRLGLSGSIDRPYSEHVTFSLKLTDLVE